MLRNQNPIQTEEATIEAVDLQAIHNLIRSPKANIPEAIQSIEPNVITVNGKQYKSIDDEESTSMEASGGYSSPGKGSQAHSSMGFADITLNRYTKKHEIENFMGADFRGSGVLGGPLQRDEKALLAEKKAQQQREMRDSLRRQMEENERRKKERLNEKRQFEQLQEDRIRQEQLIELASAPASPTKLSTKSKSLVIETVSAVPGTAAAILPSPHGQRNLQSAATVLPTPQSEGRFGSAASVMPTPQNEGRFGSAATVMPTPQNEGRFGSAATVMPSPQNEGRFGSAATIMPTPQSEGRFGSAATILPPGHSEEPLRVPPSPQQKAMQAHTRTHSQPELPLNENKKLEQIAYLNNLWGKLMENQAMLHDKVNSQQEQIKSLVAVGSRIQAKPQAQRNVGKLASARTRFAPNANNRTHLDRKRQSAASLPSHSNRPRRLNSWDAGQSKTTKSSHLEPNMYHRTPQSAAAPKQTVPTQVFSFDPRYNLDTNGKSSLIYPELADELDKFMQTHELTQTISSARKEFNASANLHDSLGDRKRFPRDVFALRRF